MKKSEVDVLMEAYFKLHETRIPQFSSSQEATIWYRKYRAQSKRTLEVYKAQGLTLDNALEDLSKLDAEARSLKFNYAIDTLTRYTFRT